MRYYLLVIGIGFILLPKLNGQSFIVGKSMMEIWQEQERYDASSFFPLPSKTKINSYLFFGLSDDNIPSLGVSNMPRAFNYNDLGMFCKIEFQMERLTKFPIRIRLGEVQQVEQKEGKWQYQTWQNFIRN